MHVVFVVVRVSCCLGFRCLEVFFCSSCVA